MPENIKMPIGKYKGVEIVNIPSDYLKWLSENWNDETICAAADEEYRKRTDYNDHFYES